jgi:hypothetical protein
MDRNIQRNSVNEENFEIRNLNFIFARINNAFASKLQKSI